MLKPLLEETLNQCPKVERRDADPVGIIWTYDDPADREVAALFASSLAYGRVSLVRDAISRALRPLGERPAHWLIEASQEVLHRTWGGYVYRMTKGADLRDLAQAIQVTLRTEGSLEGLYKSGAKESSLITDRQEHLELASRFIQTLHERRRRPQLSRGFRYLLPDPADGSTTKRLHLFFRWMSRGPDEIDLGLWDCLAPSALIMPLDTHTSRICRYLGLTQRKSTDGRTALEVTERLAKLHREDPLRYDFALCHLGISGGCIHRRSPLHCPTCPIQAACVLPDEHPS